MCPGNAIILQLLTKWMNKIYYLCVQNLYKVQLPKNKHFKQYFGLEVRTYVPIHACRPTARQKPDVNKSLMVLISAHCGAIRQKTKW